MLYFFQINRIQLQLYACWQLTFCHNKVYNVYKTRHWK